MEDLKHLREVLTEAYPREELSLDALARVVAVLDGLPAAALDGGWTFKGFTAWAQTLEADAKRYRWLRNSARIPRDADPEGHIVVCAGGGEDVLWDSGLDASIDCYMQAGEAVGAA